MDMSQVLPPRGELKMWRCRSNFHRRCRSTKDAAWESKTCRRDMGVKVREVYLWAVSSTTPPSVSSRFLGASAWMLGAKLLGAAAGFGLAWTVSRQEGPEAFGRFELGLTVLTIAAMLSRMGLDGVMVKWLAASGAKDESKVQRPLVFRALGVVFLASSVMAALLWRCSGPLAGWLGDVEAAPMWRLVACGIPCVALWGMASEMLRGLSFMRSHALAQQGLVTALAVFVLWLFRGGIFSAYAYAVVIAFAGTMALLTWALWSRNSERLATADNHEWGWRNMFQTGWPMLLGSAMFLVMSWTDTLLLGHFMEESQVGVYRVAFRLAALVTLVQAAVNSYAAPWFAQRHAIGDQAGLLQGLRQATKLNVAFSIPAFLVLAWFPEWMLGWFGSSFAAGVSCLRWLAAGQMVNALCGPVMYLLNMTGRERLAQRIVWAAAALNVGLNLWAIPRFGIVGAAAATAATMCLWNLAAAWAVHRTLGLSVWTALTTPPAK